MPLFGESCFPFFASSPVCPSPVPRQNSQTHLILVSCPLSRSLRREDISANLGALEQLQQDFGTEILLVESGGDNLAANFSRELADYIIYVVRL